MKCFLLSFFLSCGLCLEFLDTRLNKITHFAKFSNEPEAPFKCETEKECQSLIMESKCLDNICKCSDGKILSSDASKCLTPASEYGSPCEDNAQCSYTLSSGGICSDSVCMCKSGYHYLKGYCWRNVDLNEDCIKNEQCFSSYEYVGLQCADNVCKCRENYYERLQSGCRRKSGPGESCNLNLDCGEKGICERMKCQKAEKREKRPRIFSNSSLGQIWKILNCPKGTFELDGKCVRELGMQCKEDSECNHIKSAVCLDNLICACKPVLFVASDDNRKCLKVALGQIEDISRAQCLNSDSQCGVFGANSYCQDNRCACKPGTYFEVNNKFCWRIKPLGERCNVNEDCNPSATHSKCGEIDKKCVCQNGYHAKGSNCVLDSLAVGDPCESDQECLFDNSFCNSSNKCSCKKHHYLEDGKCKPGVETLCSSDEDCANLKNTECKTGNYPVKQCLCKDDYISSKDYKYCLPVSSYKGNCEESFQCEFQLGDLAECKNKICECHEGAHYSYGKCHKSKFIEESCEKLPDCFPGNDNNSVICLKGFCACNYDYELGKDRVCVKTNSGSTTKIYSVSLTSLLVLIFFVALR